MEDISALAGATRVSEQWKGVAGAMALPYVVPAIGAAVDSIKEARQGGASKAEALTEVVKNGADAISTAGYAASFVLDAGSKAVRAVGAKILGVASVVDYVQHVADASGQARKWWDATQALRAVKDGVSPVVVSVLKQSQKLALFRLMKAVLSAVAFVLSTVLLALGVAVIPSAVILIVTLASTIFSILGEQYEASMLHKPIYSFKK
jgi:hypothetical protein